MSAWNTSSSQIFLMIFVQLVAQNLNISSQDSDQMMYFFDKSNDVFVCRFQDWLNSGIKWSFIFIFILLPPSHK